MQADKPPFTTVAYVVDYLHMLCMQEIPYWIWHSASKSPAGRKYKVLTILVKGNLELLLQSHHDLDLKRISKRLRWAGRAGGRVGAVKRGG